MIKCDSPSYYLRTFNSPSQMDQMLLIIMYVSFEPACCCSNVSLRRSVGHLSSTTYKRPAAQWLVMMWSALLIGSSCSNFGLLRSSSEHSIVLLLWDFESGKTFIYHLTTELALDCSIWSTPSPSKLHHQHDKLQPWIPTAVMVKCGELLLWLPNYIPSLIEKCWFATKKYKLRPRCC